MFSFDMNSKCYALVYVRKNSSSHVPLDGVVVRKCLMNNTKLIDIIRIAGTGDRTAAL